MRIALSITSCGTEENQKLSSTRMVQVTPRLCMMSRTILNRINALTKFSPEPNKTKMERKTICGVPLQTKLADIMSFLGKCCMSDKNLRSCIFSNTLILGDNKRPVLTHINVHADSISPLKLVDFTRFIVFYERFF